MSNSEYQLIYSEDSCESKSVKHLCKKLDHETHQRNESCANIQSDICSLKKLVEEEIHVRKLMTHLFSSIGCDNTDNQIILAQQLEINHLKKHIKCISNKMEKTDEYINDLYWALFHNKPCVIAAIIEPDQP
jgi:uncharacterized protein YpuA (DUF1002 family)